MINKMVLFALVIMLCFSGITVFIFSFKSETTQEIKMTSSYDDGGYCALYTKVYYKGVLVRTWIDDLENGHVTPEEIKARKMKGDSVIAKLKKLGL